MNRLRTCCAVLLTAGLLSQIVVAGAATAAKSTTVKSATAKSSTPSFSCWWTEPFDGFELSPEGAIYFSAETPDFSGTPLTNVKVVKVGSGWNVSGKAGADTITVNITKEEGSDGMSDYTTPYAGLLNRQWNGACLKHGNGTVPRDVVGVAENDVLNVRSAPNASARIVTTIGQKGTAWVYPGKPKNGWVKVSARKYSGEESGPVTAVDGWVNGAFVASESK